MTDTLINDKTIHSDKYKSIIENTIIECNRVFSAWELSGKLATYQDYDSVLKNYLARFIRHEFSYRHNYNISAFNPLCVVIRNRVMGINFTSEERAYSYNKELKHIGEYLKTFDFEGFDKTQKLNDLITNNEELASSACVS